MRRELSGRRTRGHVIYDQMKARSTYQDTRCCCVEITELLVRSCRHTFHVASARSQCGALCSECSLFSRETVRRSTEGLRTRNLSGRSRHSHPLGQIQPIRVKIVSTPMAARRRSLLRQNGPMLDDPCGLVQDLTIKVQCISRLGDGRNGCMSFDLHQEMHDICCMS